MATISKSHKINQASKPILEELLPLSHFALRPLIPDYHVDYFVELVENDDPSGIYFGIQLKGTEKIIFKKKQIKFTLKSKHLKYYLDNVKTLPVYLIVVDIINKKAYWLFIQKYLKEAVLNKGWRNQKDVSVYINVENVINNLGDFKKNIIEANIYLKEMWPSSIEASAKKEKEYLKSLDPRFKDIEISIKEDSVNYHFHSNESFDINFKVKDGTKLKEYFDNPDREKIIFDSKDVEVSGSELMKELLKRSDHIEFKLESRVFDVDVFLLISSNDNFLSDSLNLNGKLTYHKTYFKIDCSLKNSPLKIQAIINLDFKQNPTFNFDFDFSVWINKPVKFLPYLEKLDAYFSKLKGENEALIKIEFQGNDLFIAKPKMKNYPDFIGFTDDYFALCKKLKVIDSYYNLNLLFPGFEKIKRTDLNDIEELYSLITIGEYNVVGRKLTGSFSVERKEGFLETYLKGIDIRLVSDGRYNFLGKEINIGEYLIDVSRPKLLISQGEMQELFKSDQKFIPLKFTTDENSKVIVRYLTKINPDQSNTNN